ncbi:TerD family protein [Paraclostridium sordellii]|uniref:Tellurium resistance protein n=1 Tax=Paraclostridium sordellii TaxID=1505 RepID=A0A9P1KWM5_PARSO|nr:TerD family protein [Paeniclostridium sordellii]AUN15232.1 Tellurium resistance [Paeniclostridium sordellii]CEN31532.1 tellurium resistance protein [[Clostridium] sordellii] [Paeniclostridium sordellii]
MAIELKKGNKINLSKDNKSIGEVSINLNWSQGKAKKQSLFKSLLSGGNADLDLGCLFELKDGTIGCIQALGNAFGALGRPPYIALDGDDRTGSNLKGETLRFNASKISEVKRILVYTYIYEGVANWASIDGVVTIKQDSGDDIIIKMDEYSSKKRMCALAIISNENDNCIVEKIVEYYSGHQALDKAYNWGIKWHRGRK